jgi:DNA-binding CsgD family transcriptional regulator
VTSRYSRWSTSSERLATSSDKAGLSHPRQLRSYTRSPVQAEDRSTLFGREFELDAVDRFVLGAVGSEVPNAALVLEGPPGIGKSAIWREAISRARQRGIRTLSARPSEVEGSLSYSGLTDLIGPVYDEVRDDLSAPHQQALDVVLLRAVADHRTDPRTSASGLVAVLSALAKRSPLILAIDDAQWLDPASGRALEFAVRRLPTRIHLLLTQRSESNIEPPLGLAGEFEAASRKRLRLGPLSSADLYHVIGARLGQPPSRPLLVRIASSSEGNPLYALELARSLPRGGIGLSRAVPLPMPGQLHEIIARRVNRLSEKTREVLLAVTMLSRVTATDLVAAFHSPNDVETGLAEAEDADVVVRDAVGVRFTHPLLASAVYALASAGQRRDMRRRLVEIVSDPEERARHAAYAATEPDEATALEVERAAELALRRGAQDAAADLYEAAASLTPAERPSDASRRQRGAAGARLAVGDLPGARILADSALDQASYATDIAEALVLLGQIAWVEGSGRQPIGYLERALVHAGEDRRLQGRIHALLAEYSLNDHRRVLEHSDLAAELLDERENPSLLANALLNKAFFSAQLGRGAPQDLVERAFRLEARSGPDAERNRVGLIWLTCMDETDAVRARYRVEDQWYRDRGEEGWRAERLSHLALANFYAGAWRQAESAIKESCTTVEQTGQPLGPWGMAFYIRALIDLHQGRTDQARSTLLELRDELERQQHHFFAAIVLSALGTLNIVLHDPAAATAAFQQMHSYLDAVGAVDPIGLRTDVDEIEALLALSEVDRARAVLDHLEWRHAAIPRPWTAVVLPGARGLVRAAEGDVSGGLEALMTLDLESAERVPLEHARTLLRQGRLHRRLKHRRAAAEVLGEALHRFERLGAATWEREARDELARTGLRRPEPGVLTPSELRVAELAAEGLRNREIAAAAFVSPKTVEANLARVYGKLGIKSRAELGGRMADRRRAGHPGSQT